MKRFLLYFISFLLFRQAAYAEGTKELAPNSTDITSLLINSSTYGTFAAYNGPVDSRLNFRIINPGSEQVFLGFSTWINDAGSYGGAYYFRIKNPSGTVVYGPQLINSTSVNALTVNWARASAGPIPIAGALTGYAPFTFTPTVAGDYYIEFSTSATTANTTEINIPFWDITVASTATTPVALKGRVFSTKWGLRTPTINSNDPTYGVYDRAFNGQIYTYSSDGFVTRVNFNGSGFRGFRFNLAFNSRGTGNTGNLLTDRQSKRDINATLSEYKLFLNDPDIIAYPSGQAGSFAMTPYVINCATGGLCVAYSTNFPGQVQVVLDFNSASGAGIYDAGTADVLLAQEVVAGPGETAPYKRCVPWDGKDGLGNTVNTANAVPAYLTYYQGTVHFPAYDVEYNTVGFVATAVRPTPAPGFTIRYKYDDVAINDAVSGLGEPKTNVVTGCVTPCHKWNVFNFGDANTINTFWTSNQNDVNVSTVPVLSACTISGVNVVCPGTAGTVFSAPAGAESYAWSVTGNATIASGTTGQSVTVTAGAAGTYTVSVTTTLHTCVNVCTKTVTVDQPTANTASITLCSTSPGGTTASFNLTSVNSIVTGGASGVAVTWFSNVGLTTSIPTPTAFVSGSTTVYAKVTNTTTNCTNSAAVTLIVNSSPTFNSSALTQPTCAVPSGTIVISANGTGTLEYSINGANWQTGTTFLNVIPGSYTPRVRLQSNIACVTLGSPVTINAIPVAPTVNASTVTQPICAVPSGTIVINATGSGTLEYSLNGTTWQTGATFSGLASGSYIPRARLQSSITCVTLGTSVTITGVPAVPALTITNGPNCATNLRTYSVVISVTNATTVSSTAGTVTANGGNSYTISAIPIGTNITVTATNSTTQCSSTLSITSPSCIRANPDNLGTLIRGGSITFPILSNDTLNGVVPAAAQLNTIIFLSPTKGTATLNANGTLTYVAGTTQSGTETFIYQICDKLNPSVCDTALVTLRIENPLSFLPKVYLQGSLYNVTYSNSPTNTIVDSLMRDDLRVKGLIPLTSPYTAWNPTITASPLASSVLTVTGRNAIVDWVFVELRNAANSSQVLVSQAALLQRDGDVVALDGISSLELIALNGTSYYVAIRHRNHLGVMTASPVAITTSGTTIDYRKPSTATYVIAAQSIHQSQVNVLQGKALWAGNALPDNKVVYQGTENDSEAIRMKIMNAPGNQTLMLPIYLLTGYYPEDVDMNGTVVYAGTGNDVEFIYQNIIKNHPGNLLLQNNFIIQQQLP